MAGPFDNIYADLGNVQPAPGEPIPDDMVAIDQNVTSLEDIKKLMFARAQQQDAARAQMMKTMQEREGALAQQGMNPLDRASMLFQAAGALAAPTRSGAFMESFGKAGSELAGPLSKAAQAERDRQEKLQQLQLARQKMAMEASGVSPSDLLALYKAQQEGVQKPGERERLIQTLPEDQRQEAVRGALGIREKEELKQLNLPDGTTMTVLFKDGKVYDPVTGNILDTTQLQTNRQTELKRDQQNQAIEVGVPLETRDAFANLPPKEREKARLAKYNADTRLLQKEATDLPDADLRNEINDYRTFVMLNNENQSTGPYWAKTPNISASAQQMASIEAKLKIAAGSSLKGAASDKDVAMFGQVVPSTSKDLKANVNIARFGEMRARAELERREFMRDYLAVNKTLQNADKYWEQYINANPFFKYPEKNFDPKKLKIDDLQRNDQRMSYQDYFRKKFSTAPTQVRRGPNGELIAD